MEKWFKDFINKRIEVSKKEVTTPENVVETVLKYPENYSARTLKLAKAIQISGAPSKGPISEYFQESSQRVVKGETNANNR